LNSIKVSLSLFLLINYIQWKKWWCGSTRHKLVGWFYFFANKIQWTNENQLWNPSFLYIDGVSSSFSFAFHTHTLKLFRHSICIDWRAWQDFIRKYGSIFQAFCKNIFHWCHHKILTDKHHYRTWLSVLICLYHVLTTVKIRANLNEQKFCTCQSQLSLDVACSRRLFQRILLLYFSCIVLSFLSNHISLTFSWFFIVTKIQMQKETRSRNNTREKTFYSLSYESHTTTYH